MLYLPIFQRTREGETQMLMQCQETTATSNTVLDGDCACGWNKRVQIRCFYVNVQSLHLLWIKRGYAYRGEYLLNDRGGRHGTSVSLQQLCGLASCGKPCGNSQQLEELQFRVEWSNELPDQMAKGPSTAQPE